MHDVSTSMAADLPKAVRKFGVHTRKVSNSIGEAPTDHHLRKISGTERRPRSKTVSHAQVKRMVEKRREFGTDRCFVAKRVPLARRLSDDRVLALKSYHVTRWALTGVILVKNISYEKRVFVRYSLDGWQTSEDVEAQFMSEDPVSGEVVFQFRLDFPFRLQNGTKLELALAYQMPDSTTYWDNNDGDNYVFDYSFLS